MLPRSLERLLINETPRELPLRGVFALGALRPRALPRRLVRMKQTGLPPSATRGPSSTC